MIIRQARLVQRYQEIEREGRQQFSAIKPRGVVVEEGRVRLNAEGVPEPVAYRSYYAGFGFPLPSPVVNERLKGLQEELNTCLTSGAWFFNPPNNFHITLSSQALTAEQIGNFQAWQTARTADYIKAVSRYAPFEVYSEKVLLAGDGWVIVCFYPQNFIAGREDISLFDKIRDDLGVIRPNIVHATVGGLMRGISATEQSGILAVLNRFNRKPLGTLIFDRLKIFHEKRYFLSEKELLAEIRLQG